MKVFKIVYVFTDKPDKEFYYTITAKNQAEAKDIGEKQIQALNVGKEFTIKVIEISD